MKYAKVSGNNVVIKLPIDMLVVAFDNNPNNYDEEIKVKYKRKFAEGFAQHINEHSGNAETGLTVFQEWIDQIFEEMIESDSSYIKYPKEEF
ncbi:hypothetical protein [Bacillus cereus group sp. BY5-1LC]|uniref:hypothetical protein n=1 Tax=Bacillus cereus group sp. BY5-1LC TaxID=3018078 RepID=UPI0022E89A56|nr:hypothetical protein [Bacillus cereus group sp. BY5-1LC]MDA1789224.1 hypothetical protein [Bacillus cereus group sp. BY5-1LC]